MRFKIGQTELQKRRKNLKIGSFFAAVLVIFIYYNNYEYPEKYNDVLYWSIMGFIVLANSVGYYRYRRYLNRVRDHWVEVHPKQLQFYTQGHVSNLNLDDVAALHFHHNKESLQHIQIKLKNNRGIRLEGYDDLEQLAHLLSEQVPKAHITG